MEKDVRTTLLKIHKLYQEDYIDLNSKASKKLRMEDFLNEWNDLLSPYFSIRVNYANKVVSMVNAVGWRFSYYPTSDKLQIKKWNKWMDNGLKYLIEKGIQ